MPATIIFTQVVIDQVVSDSRRQRGQTTEGARAIAKKIGHAQQGDYQSAFEGIEVTQANAERLIRDIMTDSSRIFVGDKVIDVYNVQGQGVRFDKATRNFIGFLEGVLATQ